MDDKARCDNAAVLLTTIIDALVENGLLNEGKEGDEGDVHRGRIRDVDADDVDDGANKNDDDCDDEDELQRLADDDARRRIIAALVVADAAELLKLVGCCR